MKKKHKTTVRWWLCFIGVGMLASTACSSPESRTPTPRSDQDRTTMETIDMHPHLTTKTDGSESRPPIDKKLPAVYETASFGLG